MLKTKDDKAKDKAGVGDKLHPPILADQLILIWPNFYISSKFIWNSFIWFDIA